MAGAICEYYGFSIFPVFGNLLARRIFLVSADIHISFKYKNGFGLCIVHAIGQTYRHPVSPILGDFYPCWVFLVSGHIYIAIGNKNGIGFGVRCSIGQIYWGVI